MWNAMGSYGWGAGSGWFGITHMLLWWVVLIVVVAALGRWLFASSSREPRDLGRRALDILAERYARGEVDKDEYEKRRRDLTA